MTSVPLRRCAVYTRKSSEEGLEQDFNSLHAQREACEAFIVSQRSEGWRLVPAAYDDGGISGGTLERPALKRLLDDIRAGKVDTIVVYKVDRLTRSLADFARMVELFDRHGVSFVAVTQQFNTTNSMGRLTLNVLLSFAQFEREVTGERIRDKIAASKKKGMWMGGYTPLGYDALNRKLIVNEAEAGTVRRIFERYQTLGCVRLLQEALASEGVRPKPRGALSGTTPYSRGALYAMLRNPVYLGRTRHKDTCYPGQHAAIVPQTLWDAVQALLERNTVGGIRRVSRSTTSPLAGKLVDAAARRLTPSHAVKQGRRYRYYISGHLVTGSRATARDMEGWRLPARDLERVVLGMARELLRDRSMVTSALLAAGTPVPEIPAALATLDGLAGQPEAALFAIVQQVQLTGDGLRLTLAVHANATIEALLLEAHRPMIIRRRGAELKLVVRTEQTKVDHILLKAIARARRWAYELTSGQVATIGQIASREQVTARHIAHLLPLGFLAPAVVVAITEGRQPAEITAQQLITRTQIPADWKAQAALLGFS